MCQGARSFGEIGKQARVEPLPRDADQIETAKRHQTKLPNDAPSQRAVHEQRRHAGRKQLKPRAPHRPRGIRAVSFTQPTEQRSRQRDEDDQKQIGRSHEARREQCHSEDEQLQPARAGRHFIRCRLSPHQQARHRDTTGRGQCVRRQCLDVAEQNVRVEQRTTDDHSLPRTRTDVTQPSIEQADRQAIRDEVRQRRGRVVRRDPRDDAQEERIARRAQMTECRRPR